MTLLSAEDFARVSLELSRDTHCVNFEFNIPQFEPTIRFDMKIERSRLIKANVSEL
jgi:hypothetical protein